MHKPLRQLILPVKNNHQPLMLKLNMPCLINQNICANLLQQRAMRCILQRLVKYLRSAFNRNNGKRPKLHTGIKVPHTPKKAVGPVLFYPFLPYPVKVFTHVFTMLLFLFYKKAHSSVIISIVFARRIFSRCGQQMFTVRCFAQLPGLQWF